MSASPAEPGSHPHDRRRSGAGSVLRAAALVALALALRAAASHLPPWGETHEAVRAGMPLRGCGTTRSEAGALQAGMLRDGYRLDLNRASADDLTVVSGIGPALAARIVADRARAGPFARLDDLTRVRGIGPRSVERLRPFVCAGTSSTGPDGSPSLQ